MDDPFLIEDAIRAILLAATSVTAHVGERIRPYILDEGDALPALVVSVEEENYEQDLEDSLEGDAGTARATISVHSIATSAREARLLSKRVIAALADYDEEISGAELGEISIINETHTVIPEGDDGDNWRQVVTAEFDVFYSTPSEE